MSINELIRRRWLLWASLLSLLAGVLVAWQSQAQHEQRSAWVLTIDGAIGPAISDYFQRGLRQAAESDVEIVVVQLDTPGGLDASMRDMIRAMLTSDVPVAMYVSPSGARAASAGTYLTYASHIAAMAPSTHLGSATPVQMGGGEIPDPRDSGDDGSDSRSSDNGNSANGSDSADRDGTQATEPRRGETAMERKVLEDAVSYIRGLAERHGRNADWAEEAVREAVNLTSRQALEMNVIDVVASDIEALLEQIDGHEVIMEHGERILETAGIAVERVDPDWRTQLLSVITNPNVAYFLMIIGFYGLIFELASPGSLVPGTVGIISLLLALFAFQVLPINYAGLALIIVGLALIVGEALVPSFGVLGIGGIVAFVIGSVILMDADNLRISLPLIGGVALVAAVLMLWTVTRFMGLRKTPARTGQEELLGSQAVALADFQGAGHVRLHGERWNAQADTPVSQGQTVIVTRIDGLTVHVTPQETPGK